MVSVAACHDGIRGLRGGAPPLADAAQYGSFRRRCRAAPRIVVKALRHEDRSQVPGAVAERPKTVPRVRKTHADSFTSRRQGSTCFSLFLKCFVRRAPERIAHAHRPKEPT
jgi:hypothetical protein